MSGNRCLPNLEPFIAAGINPKTQLPVKLDKDSNDCWRKEAIKKTLRIKDEQAAVNRYVWYNLPDGISSQELERMLYYRGQLCFFYEKTLGKFYFMPYALDGGLDYYGRFKRVHPVPLYEGKTAKEKRAIDRQRSALALLKLDVLYDVVFAEDVKGDIEDFIASHCVILRDYTNQLPQTIISRQELNESVIDIESDCIPFMRTALLSGTGITAVRVGGADEQGNVEAMSRRVDKAALDGEKFVAFQAMPDTATLTDGALSKADEYMLAMQALDNYRLSLYGLDNAGLFQKNTFVTDSQNQVNAGNVGIIAQDGLTNRQRFCDIVNSLTGLGIYCEISETAIGVDMNMDGFAGDEQDQSGTAEGSQPVEGGMNE